jgi:predicted RNA binding protein YcfA (HicA-like mRNA interferase family)
MTRLPSLGYEKVIKALQRDGWVIIRQRGSHIRLHKHTRMDVLKLTVPAHSPILIGFKNTVNEWDYRSQFGLFADRFLTFSGNCTG